MLFARTRANQSVGTKRGFRGAWNLLPAKTKASVPSETNLDDGDVKMTLDEQIESLEKMQKLIRQLAAEQGVVLKDDEDTLD